MEKNPSKSVRMLDALALAGDQGMSFTEIQELLWGMSHPGVPFTRVERGYWCTNLLGGAFYHAGLLRVFAVKAEHGFWCRNDVPHDGHPWVRARAQAYVVPEHLRYQDDDDQNF